MHRDGSSTYVYLSRNGARTKTGVTTGITSGTSTQISKGLTSGEQVYVETVAVARRTSTSTQQQGGTGYGGRTGGYGGFPGGGTGFGGTGGGTGEGTGYGGTGGGSGRGTR